MLVMHPFFSEGWLKALDKNRIFRKEGRFQMGELPLRRLRVGPVAIDTFGSGFNDWNLAHLKDEAHALDLIGEQIAQRKSVISHFPGLDASMNEKILMLLKKHCLFTEVAQTDVSPRLIRKSDSLMHGIAGYLKKDCEYNLRRMGRELGEVSFARATALAPEAFDFIRENHVNRRASKSEKSAFQLPRYRNFFRDGLEELSKAGLLDVSTLRNGEGKLLSVTVGMIVNGTYFYYMPTFSDVWKKYSPGKVLFFWLLSEGLGKDVQAVDFLKGGESYKYEWGAKDVPIFRIAAARKAWMLAPASRLKLLG